MTGPSAICGVADTLVVRWIDRLGRNYQDVTQSVRRFMDMGVIVRTGINGMTFDGSTTGPMQKAMRDRCWASWPPCDRLRRNPLVPNRMPRSHPDSESPDVPRHSAWTLAQHFVESVARS